MKDNKNKKSLVNIVENSIFYKVKRFFINLFHKNKTSVNDCEIEKETDFLIQSKNDTNFFMDFTKNIEDEENLILKLQKKYRSGEINEEELSLEQINSLCALYDKQIANLKKSNEIRKQRILKYRRKVQLKK